MIGTGIDVTAWLGAERASFLRLLEGLTPDQWKLPTECPAWTVKGLALHVLGDDLSLLSRQRDSSTDSLTIFAEDHPGASFRELLDGFNEQWVTASRFMSTGLIIDMVHMIGQWTEAFYSDVDLQVQAREPVGFFAADGPSPYWQVIAREYVERVVHQSQIRRAIGEADLEPDLLRVGVEVQVHAIGAWMRNLEAFDGATVGLQVGAVDSWQWVRSSEEWAVVTGTDDAAHASIAVSPELSVAVMTRGVSAAALRSDLVVSGDQTLTEPFVDLMVGFLVPPAG